MKLVIKMPDCHGDKVEVDGVALSSRQSCEKLCKAIMAAADVVWPEPPKDTTKEKNGAGNNKK